KRHIPEFTCEFEPDERQAIADSWPRTIDDRIAREDWGWRPQYDLTRMTADMLEALRNRSSPTLLKVAPRTMDHGER
ncbi:MAG TPA: hypothetical protein VIV14_03725, partial [Gammaproteobacteria bacterium]